VGTSLLATVIYKSMKKNTITSGTPPPPPPPPKPIPYNFLYTISLPFKYLLYKIQGNTSPPPLTQQTTTPIPFEDKYFKEYDEWASCMQQPETNEAHKKECLENMYYSTVRETINEFYGDVIMCYDHTTLSFAYYARTGSIPYKYLETISRKYMIDTNAPKEIHVDIRSEYNKAKECKQATATDTDTDTATNPTVDNDHEHEHEHEHEDTVFVKLKSYNNVSNLKIHTNTNDKTTTEKKDTFVRPESNAHSNMILRENANRYSYRGKITDFEEHHKLFLAERRTRTHPPSLTSTSTSTSTTSTTTPTTTKYAEFKKQMMKSAL
jgi:hypothetical protein